MIDMEFLDQSTACFLKGFKVVSYGLLPYIALALFMQIMSTLLRNCFSEGFLGKFFIFLTAPGVMVHELGHILFCLIFRHEILQVRLFSPDKNGTLGYVNHRYDSKSYYQRLGNFFIGTGPIWFGVGAILLLSWFLLPGGMIGVGNDAGVLLRTFFAGVLDKHFWIEWKSWLWAYLSFCIAVHVTLSKEDLHGSLDGFLLLLGLILILSFVLGWYDKWNDVLLVYEMNILATVLAMIAVFFLIFLVPAFLFKILSVCFGRNKSSSD